jgi:hypothetical protein
MVLIDDVKKVLLLSWSVRLSSLAAVAGALAQFQPDLGSLRDFIPPGYFGIVSIICALGAVIARVIKQESISGPAP